MILPEIGFFLHQHCWHVGPSLTKVQTWTMEQTRTLGSQAKTFLMHNLLTRPFIQAFKYSNWATIW